MFHVEHPRRAGCRHGMVARDVRRDGSCPARLPSGLPSPGGTMPFWRGVGEAYGRRVPRGTSARSKNDDAEKRARQGGETAGRNVLRDGLS